MHTTTGSSTPPLNASHLESKAASRPSAGRAAHAAARRGAVAGMLGGLMLLLAACSSSPFMPAKVVLSEAELQGLMTRQFPLEQRLLEIFEARASSPKLRLLPERNRLAAQIELQARERILGTRYGGRLDFESALLWDAAENAVRLDQVRVLDFVLDLPSTAPAAPPPSGSVRTAGVADAARRTATERLAAAAAERLLEGHVLYRLPADQLAKMDQAGVRPVALNITRNGLEITLEPKAK